MQQESVRFLAKVVIPGHPNLYYARWWRLFDKKT